MTIYLNFFRLHGPAVSFVHPHEFAHYYLGSKYAAERGRRFDAVRARIPHDASVAATEHEVPHLTTRRLACTLAIANGGADYLLVDRDHLSIGASRRMLEAALASGRYEPVLDDPPYLLFAKRKPD